VSRADDGVWQKGIKAGGSDWFAPIFEQYQGHLWRYLCSLVSDQELAADLAQDTFVKAYRALRDSPPPENLNAWLYAIATNTALSALRRRKLIAWLPLHSSSEASQKASTEDHEARTGERELLSQALAALPRDEAALILLRFQQGLDYPEIAQTLGCTMPAARMRLSRAQAAFREAYERLSEEARPWTASKRAICCLSTPMAS